MQNRSFASVFGLLSTVGLNGAVAATPPPKAVLPVHEFASVTVYFTRLPQIP